MKIKFSVGGGGKGKAFIYCGYGIFLSLFIADRRNDYGERRKGAHGAVVRRAKAFRRNALPKTRRKAPARFRANDNVARRLFRRQAAGTDSYDRNEDNAVSQGRMGNFAYYPLRQNDDVRRGRPACSGKNGAEKMSACTFASKIELFSYKWSVGVILRL